MEKITELTIEQTAALAVHRKRFFDLATCTEPADRPKAEDVACALAEIAEVKIVRIVWVNSPQEGKTARENAWHSSRDLLRASLGDSLRASLGASLGASLRNSLGDSLRASLGASLRASLGASLWDPLGASLWDSLGASLWGSLWDSLGGSLWDASWISFYSYPRDVLDIVYAPAAARKLDLRVALLESCFAVWIVPGVVILCERPATVKIVDGQLVGLTWRSEKGGPNEEMATILHDPPEK